MPARLVQVTILNNSDYPVVWQDDGRVHGFWQDPWYPSNLKNLKRGEQGTFRLESGGVATGVEGWALFKIDIPFATNVGVRTEFFRLDFDRAYIEFTSFKGGIDYTLKDPRTDDAPHTGPQLANVFSRGSSDIANIDSSPFEFVAGLPLGVPGGLFLLPNESIAKHVAWFVEVRNTVEVSTLPLVVAKSDSILYAVTPRVEASGFSETLPASALDQPGPGRGTPASGGDLLWARHEGRQDETFKWDGPEKVGTRWDGLAKVFSAGSGILYGVTPRVDPVFSAGVLKVDEAGGHVGGNILTPGSGGDLMWFRHVGREDGSFRWEGPRRVGIRWDGFKHLFADGEGAIYGIEENGDLMWFHHVGREDGSFVWQGPKKVGTGWGGLTKVFSGGDGIIYAVTPKVHEERHRTGGTVASSGGDLVWYRHLGHSDGSFRWEGPKTVGIGWDGLKEVFCDEQGILYGITPTVAASLASDTLALSSSGGLVGNFTPASGGDLMWYRHIGWQDGSFHWAEPKKVGTGWGSLAKVFSGGVV